jgi:hypothetical protein
MKIKNLYWWAGFFVISPLIVWLISGLKSFRYYNFFAFPFEIYHIDLIVYAPTLIVALYSFLSYLFFGILVIIRKEESFSRLCIATCANFFTIIFTTIFLKDIGALEYMARGAIHMSWFFPLPLAKFENEINFYNFLIPIVIALQIVFLITFLYLGYRIGKTQKK